MAKAQDSRRPSSSPEERENRLIALSYDQAESMLKSGRASSQLVTHFVKQGSPTERLKREQLEKQNELLDAKIKAYNSMSDSAVAMNEVLAALKSYSGQTGVEEDFDECDWEDD